MFLLSLAQGCTALTAPALTQQVRFKGQLAPRMVKFMKRHRGKIPIPTGGSTKGTTLAFGDYGIRIRSAGLRLSAKQLETVQDLLRRLLKSTKGAQIWMRVFPDIPVCVKGNEVRMGRGKGLFEYWATRVNTNRVLFEIGGVPIREEIARDVLRQAAAKLPCVMEFITRSTPPRVGNIDVAPPGSFIRNGKVVPLPMTVALAPPPLMPLAV